MARSQGMKTPKTLFPIEHNIPIPKAVPNATKYPFAEMSIGDSFEVPENAFRRAREAAYAYGRYHGMKFRSSNDLCRIWRVE